jgi:gliding motility-associated lipoprotein GldH
MKAKLYLITLISIFFIIACDNGRIYEEYYALGSEGWNKDSVAHFYFNIDDSIAHYNLLINSRNLENYPYSNLWLFVDVVAPDSTTIRDTIQYQLANPNGKWTGTGTGGVYLNQFNFRNDVYFPSSGIYELKIQHAMRDDLLKGVRDIGVRIEKR